MRTNTTVVTCRAGRSATIPLWRSSTIAVLWFGSTMLAFAQSAPASGQGDPYEALANSAIQIGQQMMQAGQLQMMVGQQQLETMKLKRMFCARVVPTEPDGMLRAVCGLAPIPIVQQPATTQQASPAPELPSK